MWCLWWCVWRCFLYFLWVFLLWYWIDGLVVVFIWCWFSGLDCGDGCVVWFGNLLYELLCLDWCWCNLWLCYLELVGSMWIIVWIFFWCWWLWLVVYDVWDVVWILVDCCLYCGCLLVFWCVWLLLWWCDGWDWCLWRFFDGFCCLFIVWVFFIFLVWCWLVWDYSFLGFGWWVVCLVVWICLGVLFLGSDGLLSVFCWYVWSLVMWGLVLNMVWWLFWWCCCFLIWCVVVVVCCWFLWLCIGCWDCCGLNMWNWVLLCCVVVLWFLILVWICRLYWGIGWFLCVWGICLNC